MIAGKYRGSESAARKYNSSMLHARIAVFELEKLCFYFTVISGFLGSAFFAIPLGFFTVFPFRIFFIFTFVFICGTYICTGKINNSSDWDSTLYDVFLVLDCMGCN